MKGVVRSEGEGSSRAGESDDKEITILGRVVKWTSWGIECQADPRHKTIILERVGLDGESKGLTTNGRAEDRNEDEECFECENAKGCKAVAARLDFLAQDCPDLQFGAKEVKRDSIRGRRGGGG